MRQTTPSSFLGSPSSFTGLSNCTGGRARAGRGSTQPDSIQLDPTARQPSDISHPPYPRYSETRPPCAVLRKNTRTAAFKTSFLLFRPLKSFSPKSRPTIAAYATTAEENEGAGVKKRSQKSRDPLGR